VAFSPDGKQIVSGSDDNSIRVWDTVSGDVVVGPLKGHTGSADSVALPDAKLIVSESVSLLNSFLKSSISAHSQTTNSTDSDVAHVSSNIPYIHQDCFIGVLENASIFEDGWLKSSPSVFLFWVPPWNRSGFCWPRSPVILTHMMTKADFSNFKHGELWQQCQLSYSPNNALSS